MPTESPTNIAQQEYAKLSMLPGGFLTLPEHFFCDDQRDKGVRIEVPSMSFLVQPPNGRKIVFDLGLRKEWQNYSPDIQSHLQKRLPIRTAPDISDCLRDGGLQPSDVDAIIYSHVHYDHVGTPSDFARAQFIVGYGTRNLLKNGMKYHSAANFEKDLLPEDRVIELPAPNRPILAAEAFDESIFKKTKPLQAFSPNCDSIWKPRHCFDHTIDLFGDGLVFLVDSPGHIAGHLNLLVRVSKNKWVYLAGDACHHPRILNGQAGMAEWEENGQHLCIHIDKPKAMETVRKIQNIQRMGLEDAEVEVVLAHDAEWFKNNQAVVWPHSW